MDGPARPPHLSGSASGTVTPASAPLKRSFDDLGSDDTLSVDGSGSSSAQASTNGDNDRNKRARSRSPLLVEASDADRLVPSSLVPSPYPSLAPPTNRSTSSEPSTAGASNGVLIDASRVSLPPQVSSVPSNSNPNSVSTVGVEIQVIEPLGHDNPAAHVAAGTTAPIPIPVPASRTTPFTSPISVASSATIGHTPARIDTRATNSGRPASPSDRATTRREDTLSRAREFQATVDAIRAIGPPSSESSASSNSHLSVNHYPNDVIRPDVRDSSSRSAVTSGQSSVTESNIGRGSPPPVMITLDPYSMEPVASLEESPPPSPDASAGDDNQSSVFARHLSRLRGRAALFPRLQAGTSPGDLSLPSSNLPWDTSRASEINNSSRMLIQERSDTEIPPVMDRGPGSHTSVRRVRVPLHATSGVEDRNVMVRPGDGGIMGEQQSSRTVSMTNSQPNSREPSATQVSLSPPPPNRRQNAPLVPLRPLQPLPPLRPPSIIPPAANRTDAASFGEVDRVHTQRAASREINTTESSIRMSIDISPPLSPSSSASSLSDDVWISDTTRASIQRAHERRHMPGNVGRTRRIWDHTTGVSYDVPIGRWEDSWAPRPPPGVPRTSQPLDPSLSSPYPSSLEPAPVAGSLSPNIDAMFPPALGPIERRSHNTSRDNRPVSPPRLSAATFALRPPRLRPPRASVVNAIARRRGADTGRGTGVSNSARNNNTASSEPQTHPRRLPPFPPDGPSQPPTMSELSSGTRSRPSLEPFPPSPPSVSVGFHDLMEEYLADLDPEAGASDPSVVHVDNPVPAQRGTRNREDAPPGSIPVFTSIPDRMRTGTEPVVWRNSPAPGDTAEPRPANNTGTLLRVEEHEGWSVYAASGSIRPTDRDGHNTHSEPRRSIPPLPPISMRRHGGEAPPEAPEHRLFDTLDSGHFSAARPPRSANQQHMWPYSSDRPSYSHFHQQARHQPPDIVASNNGNQQAQGPPLPHPYSTPWLISRNPSTVNRGGGMDFSAPPINRFEQRLREFMDGDYTSGNDSGDGSTDHRAAPIRSVRGGLATQPPEAWSSVTSLGIPTGTRTPEAQRASQSSLPNSWELEQEMIRLQQIMQEATESAQALMRYADRIAGSASSRASSFHSRLPTRAQYTRRNYPSSPSWEGMQEDTPSDARRERLAGGGLVLEDLDQDSDVAERQRARLRERRRIRDLANDVQRAASGVERIIGFMGREGRAESQEARPQRTLPRNDSDRRSGVTVLPTPGARSASGVSNSPAFFSPFITGVQPSRGPRHMDVHEVSYPPNVAGSGASAPPDPFSGSLNTSQSSRPQYSEPTGTSGSDSTLGMHAPAVRLQLRQRVAPIHPRTGYTRDSPHPGTASRSGFYRAGRVENGEDRPFHQIFAAHRLANRDYIPDSSWDTSYESLLRLEARIGEARSRHTPAEILSTLQRGTFREFPNPTNETRCPICLDDYTDNDTVLAMHPCSHFFHSDCLQQWLQTSRSCPNCRTRAQMRTQPETHASRPREHEEPSLPSANLTLRTAPSPMFSGYSVIHHASQTSSPATSVFPVPAEPFQVSNASSPVDPAFDLPSNASADQTERNLPEDMDQDSQDARRGRQP